MANNYTEIDLTHLVPSLDRLTGEDIQSFVDLTRPNTFRDLDNFVSELYGDSTTESMSVRERQRQLYGTWAVAEPEVISISNNSFDESINHMANRIRNEIDNEIINGMLDHSEWTPAAGFNRGIISKKKRKLGLRLNDDLFKME